MDNKIQLDKKENNGSILKAIIAALVLLLLGSGFFVYKYMNDAKLAQTNELKIVEQKAGLLANLEKQKADYDIAINDKSAISADLEAERVKVIQLIAEVKKAKGDLNSLVSYKQKYVVLESKMKALMLQNEELKKKNISLTSQRDSTITILGESKKYNDELLNQNTELTNEMIKASKLTLFGLKGSAFKIRSSGKEIETEKANAADMIKITFSVAKNPVAKPGDRFYYIQIIDANNNVFGSKQTQTFGSKVLTYSMKSKVAFKGETVNVLEEILSKDFQKGTYFVNIFDQGSLIADCTFILR